MVKCAPEQFFAVSLENTAFSEKIIKYENIYHLIFDKKGFIHFYRQMIPSPKKWLCPPKFCFPIFSKNVAFFENIVK